MSGSVKFFYAPMNSAKSAIALQMVHQYRTVGRVVGLYTRGDRSGTASISSRLGISAECYEYTEYSNFIEDPPSTVELIIIDEAQFLTRSQVNQLIEIADLHHKDVYCFGLLTDFKTRLFEGSQRLVEVADTLVALQTKSLCWCGSEGQFNARVVDGKLTTAGNQILIGDVGQDSTYSVLCRKHYRMGMVH